MSPLDRPTPSRERRKAAYERAHSSSKKLRRRLEGRDSRAEAEHSRRLKERTHFSHNNNQKVSEVAWRKLRLAEARGGEVSE